MEGWMVGRRDIQMDGWMDGCVDRWTADWMVGRWTVGWMDGRLDTVDSRNLVLA